MMLFNYITAQLLEKESCLSATIEQLQSQLQNQIKQIEETESEIFELKMQLSKTENDFLINKENYKNEQQILKQNHAEIQQKYNEEKENNSKNVTNYLL
eukprot:Pgem_evm1s15198